MSDQGKKDYLPILEPKDVIGQALFFYTLCFCIGATIMRFFHHSLASVLQDFSQGIHLKKSMLLILLATVFLIFFSSSLEYWVKDFKETKVFYAKIFSSLNLWMCFILAFLSSVGEEFLFRGALQPYLGLALTSLLFGILHLSPKGRINAYTLWAVGAGIVLGAVYEKSGSILSVVIIHFVLNFTALVRFKYEMKET